MSSRRATGDGVWGRNREHGAVLVHIALAMLATVGFSVFVLDYGILWVSRRQAQNAADAAAFAGAVALAWDDYANRTNSGPAKQSALNVAQQHIVWSQTPSVTTGDVTFPLCPDGSDACVQVDVFRNQARGNPLPVLFGPLVGVTAHGVRATATAQAKPAPATDCMKPWAVPDKWTERQTPPWSVGDTFDKYQGNGGGGGGNGNGNGRGGGGNGRGGQLPNADIYVAPTRNSTGTGFSIPVDLGLLLPLKFGDPTAATSPGFYYPVALPRLTGPQNGGAKYRENIVTCNGVIVQIGDKLTIEPGNMIGPTRDGVIQLIAKDPNARFDTGTGTIVGSCAQDPVPCAAFSPRLVPIAMFDPDKYESGRQTGRLDLTVSNIGGFFIVGLNGNDVMGHLMLYTGVPSTGTSPVDDEASFLKAVVMVR